MLRTTAVLVVVLSLIVGFGDLARAEFRSQAEETLAHIEDAGIVWQGRFVQPEYVHCLIAQEAIWFEDGSAIC